MKVVIIFRSVQMTLRVIINIATQAKIVKEVKVVNDNQTKINWANNVNNILLQAASADIVSIKNNCCKKPF